MRVIMKVGNWKVVQPDQLELVMGVDSWGDECPTRRDMESWVKGSGHLAMEWETRAYPYPSHVIIYDTEPEENEFGPISP